MSTQEEKPEQEQPITIAQMSRSKRKEVKRALQEHWLARADYNDYITTQDNDVRTILKQRMLSSARALYPGVDSRSIAGYFKGVVDKQRVPMDVPEAPQTQTETRESAPEELIPPQSLAQPANIAIPASFVPPEPTQVSSPPETNSSPEVVTPPETDDILEDDVNKRNAVWQLSMEKAIASENSIRATELNELKQKVAENTERQEQFQQQLLAALQHNQSAPPPPPPPPATKPSVDIMKYAVKAAPQGNGKPKPPETGLVDSANAGDPGDIATSTDDPRGSLTGIDPTTGRPLLYRVGDTVVERMETGEETPLFEYTGKVVLADPYRVVLFETWKKRHGYTGDYAHALVEAFDYFMKERGVDLQYVERKDSAVWRGGGRESRLPVPGQQQE